MFKKISVFLTLSVFASCGNLDRQEDPAKDISSDGVVVDRSPSPPELVYSLVKGGDVDRDGFPDDFIFQANRQGLDFVKQDMVFSMGEHFDIGGVEQLSAFKGKHHNIQGLDAPDLEFTRGKPYQPGRPVYGNITLEIRDSNDCDDDCDGFIKETQMLIETGGSYRKSGSVIFLDRAGQEVLRINLFECWPVKVEAKPDADGIVRWTIEVRVDRIEMK